MYLVFTTSIVFANNIDWRKCLGKNDLSSSYSSKPAYCYDVDLKLRSEKELNILIYKQDQSKKSNKVNISDVEKKLSQSNYKIVLFEDFSKKFKYKKIKKNIRKFEYFLPSEPNWKAFRDSMKIENEEMIMTIKPGTRQWDGDKKNGTERAEWGFYVVNGKKLIKRNKFIKLSYDFKLPKNSSKLFKNERRTMISQLKIDGGKFPGYSPPSAFYVHKYGAATCVDYNNQRKSKKLQIQNHTRIPGSINIYDGNWHKVEFILKLGRGDGYCMVKIDGKKIIEKINYDNDLDPKEQLVARFGPYRDKSDNTQQIFFDNIEVGYFQID